MVEKFNEGASYSSLNTCRSAVSFLCGDFIRQSPLICRLLKGVFKLRPPKPKYDRIYNLDPVLKNLENLYPLGNLNLKQLTIKLLMILTLITAHRKQTLSLIKTQTQICFLLLLKNLINLLLRILLVAGLGLF